MNQDLNKEPKEYVDYEEQYKELIEEEKEKASRSMFVRMLIIFVIILLLLFGSTFLYLKMYGDKTRHYYGTCKINCDTNNDGKCDLNCDTNNDGKADTNIDTNNDGKCDKQCTYAKDDKILDIATEDIVTLYTTYNRDVVAKGIQPGWSDTQKLTVENKSKKSLIYSLKFTDVVNEFNPNSELTYTVKRDGIVVVPTTASPLTDTYILKEVLIPAHTTYVYTIDYHFIETGHLQNYQLENKFNARIAVETK